MEVAYSTCCTEASLPLSSGAQTPISLLHPPLISIGCDKQKTAVTEVHHASGACDKTHPDGPSICHVP